MFRFRGGGDALGYVGSYDVEEPMSYGMDAEVYYDDDGGLLEEEGGGEGADGLVQRSIGRQPIRFQSLCPSIVTRVNLDTSVYRQSGYNEVTCLHPYQDVRGGNQEHNKLCGGAGFACVQRNRSILLLKHSGDSCYRTEPRIIDSACECAWKTHSLGDISEYLADL